jgi:TatA/E family protein of Tat protein translocase
MFSPGLHRVKKARHQEKNMFGMGMSEIIVILVIALIVIGPKKLPEIAKSLGKAMGEFKRATNDFKDSISINDPPPGYKPIDIYTRDQAVNGESEAAKTPETPMTDGTNPNDETEKIKP